jgi:hypothetical protein
MGDLITARLFYDRITRNKESFIDLEDMGIGSVMTHIIGIILMIYAGYLAWNCNKKSGLLMRILFTILAIYFGLLYLIYYFIRYKVLGGSCDDDLFPNISEKLGMQGESKSEPKLESQPEREQPLPKSQPGGRRIAGGKKTKKNKKKNNKNNN